jgi:ubiquinone/menaquinone biosynthesis C-methylase UbiE
VTPGEWVLDAGRGTGDYALALVAAGFQVIGVDYAPGMLARAQSKVTEAQTKTVQFQRADLNARLDFPGARFDHVINVSALQVMADPVATLRKLWRVLKPGGTLVLLQVPRPETHDLPLREAVRDRLQHHKHRTPWKTALIAAKTWAERTGKTRYWTAPELCKMLAVSQFSVLSLDDGRPLVVVAEKVEDDSECERTF